MWVLLLIASLTFSEVIFSGGCQGNLLKIQKKMDFRIIQLKRKMKLGNHSSLVCFFSQDVLCSKKESPFIP
ncbi:MAG: hypothetical protein A2520_04755 [Deltaproteobacteria bacterium RIFOXYD12_FULL_53_23]|nr:MAG: hypothetical protein A2520_04755 [Deltaproteobacteria bacterium RIFOXYD12_FULL_53_23]